jgi:hypothetical protein
LTANTNGTFNGYFRCNVCLARNELEMDTILFLKSVTGKDVKQFKMKRKLDSEETPRRTTPARLSFFKSITSMIGRKQESAPLNVRTTSESANNSKGAPLLSQHMSSESKNI